MEISLDLNFSNEVENVRNDLSSSFQSYPYFNLNFSEVVKN